MPIFKKNDAGDDQLPVGKPELVPADYNRKNDYADIKRSIEAQKGNFSYEQYQWWTKFLTQREQTMAEMASFPVWFLEGLEKYKEENAPTNTDHISPLSLLLEKETSCPTVYTGKKTTSKQLQRPREKKDPAPCIGLMVAFTSAGNGVTPKVGKIIDIDGETLKIDLYCGKLTAIQKPKLKPNGRPHLILVNRARLIYVFNLTSSNRIPALALKKIKQ